MSGLLEQRPLVAHVVFRFDVGGLENGVVNLIDRLPHQKWRHAILALDRIAPAFAARVRRKDVEYIELRKPPGHLVWHYPRLVSLLHRLRPAIVHTRNLAALEATVPAWIARVPVRIHGEHGWDVADVAGNSGKHRWIRRAYRPFVSSYVALSRHIERYLTEVVGIRAGAVQRICNGVDTVRFQPAADSRESISESPFIDPALWIVGTVGRLAAVKDQVNLARAFVRLRSLDSEVARVARLIIAGDGPARASVEQVLREGGAERHAWLAGERADVPAFMRGLDLFVLPSLAEGISNTILEAMATRLPIIATRVGGNSDLLDHGRTGWLVPPADPVELSDAMLGAFRDRARAAQWGLAAREACEKQFSLDRMVAEYSALYERELARSGRAVHVRERAETPY
jgi:sugar transferase (PEP-CTERM/EpsH1 system associated)